MLTEIPTQRSIPRLTMCGRNKLPPARGCCLVKGGRNVSCTPGTRLGVVKADGTKLGYPHTGIGSALAVLEFKDQISITAYWFEISHNSDKIYFACFILEWFFSSLLTGVVEYKEGARNSRTNVTSSLLGSPMPLLRRNTPLLSALAAEALASYLLTEVEIKCSDRDLN